MAQNYCTGPVHAFIYLPRGLSKNAQYLGTCEKWPRFSIRYQYQGVFNDISGDIPLDFSFKGRDAIVGLDLTRWNEPVHAQIAAMPHGNPARRGEEILGDEGTLMIAEGAAPVLYLVFPYALKPAMAAGGMPPGYRWTAAIPIGPEEHDPQGTTAKKLHLMFHCIRRFDPKTGGMLLYDHNVSGLPPVN